MESMHACCQLMLYHCSSRARIAGAKRVCEAAPDTLVRQALVFIRYSNPAILFDPIHLI